MMQHTELTQQWWLDVVRAAEDVPAEVTDALPVAASVPGTVHTDLLAAGLIADPYLDLNELATPWIGRSDWRFTTRMPDLPGTATRADLVFDGLDTLATVSLDGREIARTRNMFRSHRIRLDPHGAGGERLEVRMDTPFGPFDAATESDQRAFDAPEAHIRKMACNFGWDWGPKLTTSGIWRSVRVESWSVARLESVRLSTTLLDGVGHARAVVTIERDGVTVASDLVATAEVCGIETELVIPADADSGEIVLEVPLEPADAWWPRGYGAPARHGFTLRLHTREGAVLDDFAREIGFRSATVNTAPDAEGTPFEFVINGVRVPIRGFNWIPDDCFPHRVTADDIAARLDAAVEANANLIRVWGGGLYESDEFYRACDERGLLVWQDFAFACAPYPETDGLAREIELEARENVTRLMSHPSLVLWNGNNENWLGHDDWGWQERLGDRPWGSGYYLELLPRVVADVDPFAVYWPGSPYSGSPDLYSNDRAHGVVHLWDAWNSEGYQVFRSDRPRFVSEFGWQAPPAWRTLTDAVHDDPLTPSSPGVLHHQKAEDGNGKLSRGLTPYFDEPSEMADWHWAMQLNQARAIRFAVEHFRSLRPVNMGTILWQLNDCWPVASWAVIDSAGRRRPGWYATRDAFAPRLATIQPRDGGLALVAVNDSTRTWSGAARIRRIDADGAELASAEVAFDAAPASASTVMIPASLAATSGGEREFLVADVDGADRAWWWFVPDREFAYSVPRFEIEVSPSPDSGADAVHVIRVRAQVPVRDLNVLADRLGESATANTALVSLLPGETAEFRISGLLESPAAELVSAEALRHAGDLVARAS